MTLDGGVQDLSQPEAEDTLLGGPNMDNTINPFAVPLETDEAK
jgi:hypothetical protein